MHDLGLWRNGWLISHAFGSETEIRLFSIHEILQVKPPQLVPEGLWDHQEASNYDINLTHRITLPIANPFRVHDL